MNGSGLVECFGSATLRILARAWAVSSRSAASHAPGAGQSSSFLPSQGGLGKGAPCRALFCRRLRQRAW